MLRKQASGGRLFNLVIHRREIRVSLRRLHTPLQGQGTAVRREATRARFDNRSTLVLDDPFGDGIGSRVGHGARILATCCGVEGSIGGSVILLMKRLPVRAKSAQVP